MYNPRYQIIVFKKDSYIRCWRTGKEYKEFRHIPYGQVHRACNFNGRECVRHLCGDSRCINPLHHREGSFSENMDDKWERKTWMDMYKNAIMEEIGMENYDEFILDEMASALYADKVAYEIRNMHLYMIDNRRMAKTVWQSIVMATSNLIIVDNHKELIERSERWKEEKEHRKLVYQFNLE